MSQEKINILHLVHKYAIGGAEMVIANLCKHASPNINNIICSFNIPDDEFVKDHPANSIIYLGKKEGNDYSIVKKIKKIIREHEIKIVHAQGWATYLEGLLAVKLTFKNKPKFIFAFHGKTMQDVKYGIPFRRKVAQRIASYFSNIIIAPSLEMTSDYQKTFRVNKSKIRLIYNGVDIKRFADSTTSSKSEFGLDENDFVVGFVGRFDPVKNIAGIILAFQKFILTLKDQEGKQAKLLLVGDGPEQANIEELVTKLNLTQHVVLWGRSNQIPKCLAAMDVYIQPSYYEGHSNTIIEAMAASLPVISTDVGGTKEIISHGKNGFLFHPDDDKGMAAIMLDYKKSFPLRQKIGKEAYRTSAANFSVEQMVEGYESLYQNLLSNNFTQKNTLTGLTK